MAITIAKFLEKAQIYRLEILAGKEGVHNIADWFHFVETLSYARELREQMLLFTTGSTITSEQELYDLIAVQIEKKSAGTVLIEDKYISNIPESVFELCEQNAYPLISCPADIWLPDVIKMLSSLFLEAEKSGIALGTALKNAISFPTRKETYVNIFYQYGFEDAYFYTLASIRLGNRSVTRSLTSIRETGHIIEKILMSFGDKSFVINGEFEYTLLFCNYSQDVIVTVLEKIVRALTPEWKEVYVGVGSTFLGLDKISASHIQAIKMLGLHEKRKTPNKVISYNELGMYQILFAINQQEVLDEYYLNCVGLLEELDMKKNGNYLEVLRVYLEKNSSINETAELLFLHRNTVNYKIRKIESLLDCNLADIHTKVQLYLALAIKDFR